MYVPLVATQQRAALTPTTPTCRSAWLSRGTTLAPWWRAPARIPARTRTGYHDAMHRVPPMAGSNGGTTAADASAGMERDAPSLINDQVVFGNDADEFWPERHLDENGELLPGAFETNQAGHVTFGFGRRICVGKDLATESLFIDTVRILWATKLERIQDENGIEVPLDIETIVETGAVL